MAAVVDWLDACRSRRLDALVDLYDEAATLECACDGTKSLTGRAALEAYWRPKLMDPSLGSFSMNDVTADGEGVILDYQSYEGKPVRIHFRFNDSGKILHTRCHPLDHCARRGSVAVVADAITVRRSLLGRLRLVFQPNDETIPAP